MIIKICVLGIMTMLLGGCFKFVGIEHSIYGSMHRSQGGGENFAEYTTGHSEYTGGWSAGTKIKTIWKRD